MKTELYNANALLEHELELLWRFAIRLTDNPEQAEVLVHETCLIVNSQHRQYTDAASFRREVIQLEFRTWYMEFRSRLLQAVTVNGNPDGNVNESAECFRGKLYEQINRLPEAQRLVILLVYIECYSQSEAAEILGVSEETVVSRLVRARLTIGNQQRGLDRVGTAPSASVAG